MPLIKSGSKAAVSKNISEFHTGPTYAHTLSKFGKARANAQAIAVALSNARKYKADGGAVTDDYTTKLSPDDEEKFQSWKQQYAPHDSGADYDLRGAYKEGLTPDPKTGHWPDTYKKPNHPTFSNESKYAKDRPDLAGSWRGEQYIPHKADGGRILRYARGGTPHYGGLIKSAIPGRTDKIPLNVPSGSYIVPADIPSAVGQGNTEAGSQILSKMFKIGPYGSGMTGAIHAGRPFQPKFDWMRFPRVPRQPAQPRQEGGETGEVPIIAAGGEMVIPPHVVREIGNGDLKAGHRVLDALVLSIRKQHIKTLKNLKAPKK